MSSKKLVFKEDEVERLRTKIGQVSQDTNQLYLQLKGQANSWDGIPLGQNLLQAQVLINELTVDAEKLEDVLRAAIKGVQDVQNENKRQMSQVEQRFSLLGGMFGRFGGGSGTGRIQIPSFASQAVTRLISTVSILMGRDGLHSDPTVQKLQNIIQKFSFGTTESIAAQSKLKDIYEARDVIAKAQTAYEVYQAFGNNNQMNAVHKLAEDARKRLESLGVDEVQFREGKDLSGHFKQPAVKACDYDPSITTSSVPLNQDEAYLLLLRMALEPRDKGDWAKNQLEIIHHGGQGILLANPNSEAWRGIVNQAMVQDIKNGPPVEEVRGDQGDWRSRPAKKDFIDKYLVDPLDELLTGEKPGIKTQGQQAMEAQFFAMQMEQQSVLSEFTSDFQATLRGAASADRITEVLGIGTVNLKSGTNKNGQIQSSSGMGGSGFGKIKELDGVEVGEMKPLLDDLKPIFKGTNGTGDFDYKEWEDMTVSGQVKIAPNGQRIISIRDLKRFTKEMQGNNIEVIVDKKENILPEFADGGFDPKTGQIVLKKEPTYLSTMHESYHAKQWLELGKEEYLKLSTLDREEYVYSQIMKNKDLYTVEEILFSQKYIFKLRTGGWPPPGWKGFE